MVAALVDELRDDPDALAELAAALAPYLPATGEPSLAGLTTVQAADAAGVSEKTVRRALAAGTLDGERRAGRWRIDAAALERWTVAGCPTARVPLDDPGRPRSRAAHWTGVEAITGPAGPSRQPNPEWVT